MNNKNEVKLSSSWTNVGLYGGTIMCLVFIPMMIALISSQKFHIGMVFGSILFAFFVCFVIYQYIYVCDARIVDDKLVLQKKFRPAKVYSYDKIGYPSSFQFKNTKYTTVEMTNEDGSIENYLIINSNALLSFENKDAEQILINLRNIARAGNQMFIPNATV